MHTASTLTAWIIVLGPLVLALCGIVGIIIADLRTEISKH